MAEQGRIEPKSPDGSNSKDYCKIFTFNTITDKNINSEPKKKTLQVFASLHETDEN
jgi:hypothetical protein